MLLDRSPARPLHAAAILALALCSVTSAALGQTIAARNSAANIGATPWKDCRSAGKEVATGLDAARRMLERTWLARERTLFAAYTMPGEKRNPFDLSPRAPDSGPRDGFVEAQQPVCTFRASPTGGGSLEVRFTSPFYRFYEAGPGWSPPMRKGLLLEVQLAPAPEGWNAVSPPSELTVLLPDQKPHKPETGRLPPAAPWAEPVPGCGKRQRWNGSDCIARKR
ncbi:MAG: hypothetical protein R3D44_04930 [Hyphomicrobiaceae bacterium]